MNVSSAIPFFTLPVYLHVIMNARSESCNNEWEIDIRLLEGYEVDVRE